MRPPPSSAVKGGCLPGTRPFSPVTPEKAANCASALTLSAEGIPMDIITAIEQRRSIRAYTERPVEKEVLDRLLDLAVKAPTGSGLEPWGFVILQRQDEIDELSERIKAKVLEHIDRYPEFSQYESWLRNEKYHIFNHAGTVIVIYGDDRSPWYIHDCTLAAGNIMLAAGSEGLGCCWIGFARVLLDDDDFKKEHGVPDSFHLAATLSLGYAAVSVPPCHRKSPVIFSRTR